jgi:hypothetical protein
LEFFLAMANITLGFRQLIGGLFAALCYGEYHDRIKPVPARPVWSNQATFSSSISHG